MLKMQPRSNEQAALEDSEDTTSSEGDCSDNGNVCPSSHICNGPSFRSCECNNYGLDLALPVGEEVHFDDGHVRFGRGIDRAPQLSMSLPPVRQDLTVADLRTQYNDKMRMRLKSDWRKELPDKSSKARSRWVKGPGGRSLKRYA